VSYSPLGHSALIVILYTEGLKQQSNGEKRKEKEEEINK